jgi:hypothetical protein
MFDQKSLKLFEAYDRQTLASGSPMSLAGALLRAPGQLLRDIGAGERAGERASALLLVTAVFCAGYGAVLGLFSGGMQPLLAAAKLPIIVVGSALLCTPTLYVFNALSGSRLTYLQTVSLALLMAAALALMLVAFAPIVWFFGVSTEGSAFMRTLHLAVFAVAAGFGLRTLNVARNYMEFRGGSAVLGSGLYFIWSILVVVVGLQMAWWFRPLLSPGPFHTGQRGLFLDFLLGV